MLAVLSTVFLLGASFPGDLFFVEGDFRDMEDFGQTGSVQLVYLEEDCFLALSDGILPGSDHRELIETGPVDLDRYRILYTALCDRGIPELPGEVVLSTDGFLLIRLRDPVQVPVTVPGAGILRPLRPFHGSICDPDASYSSADSVMVDAIAGAVSADSILAFVAQMQSYGTRYMNRPEYDACADWADTWMSTHWIPCELQTFYYMGDSMSNVVAEIQGVENPDSIYVICAHLDSYCDNPANAPGADDNASGSAAVLEAARVMAPYSFRNTVRFVLFAAEEAWMVGSEYYVQQAYGQGDRILGAINLDMVLWAPNQIDSVFIPYDTRSAPLASAAGEAFERYSPGIQPRLTYDPGAPSDHASFWQYGYSAIEIAEGSVEEIWGGYNPYYHQPEDILANYLPSLPYGPSVIRAAIGLFATLADPVGPSSADGEDIPGGSLRIATNPCMSGSVGILLPEGISQGMEFSIVDLSGRIVATCTSGGSDEMTVDLGSLPGGVYTIACPGSGMAPARFVLLD